MANNRNNTTTTFKADISSLKSAMQEASRQIRLANSEFKAATAGLDDWSKSAEGIKAKLNQLEEVEKQQVNQLKSLEKQYELTAAEEGETSKGAEELKIKINNQKAAIESTKKEIKKYEGDLDDLEKQSEGTGDATKKLGNEAKNAGEKAEDAGNGGFTVLKGAIANLVSEAIQVGINKLKEFGEAVVNVGMDFDSAMSKVAAVSGASGDELQALRDKAKEMGATTAFTATEAAEAMNYMAMAGWKTEQMLNGIDGIMNLAAASGEDLGTTSDIVTDALTAFGMKAEDSTHFADILAAAAANANTNVSMLGESFKYAAAPAGALGYSAEDVAIALGLMANSGIKASMAGTSLRNMFTRMAKPTKESEAAMTRLGLSLYDDSGKMYSLLEIMMQLRGSFQEINMPLEEYNAKLDDLDEQLDDGSITQKKYDEQLEELNKRAFGAAGAEKARAAAMLGGARAMSALIAIANSSDEDFNNLTQAIYLSDGAASQMAETMLDNLGGSVTILKSKIEALQLELFEKLEPTLRAIVEAFGSFVDALKSTDGEAQVLKATLVALAAAIAALALSHIIMSLYTAFTAVFAAVKAGTPLMAALNATMSANPIAIVISLLAGLAAAFIYLWNTSDEFRAFWVSLFMSIVITVTNAVNKIKQFFTELFIAITSTVLEKVKTIKNTFELLPKVFTAAWEGLKSGAKKAWEGVKETFSTVATFFGDIFSTAWEKVKNVFSTAGNLFVDIKDAILEGFKAIANQFIEGLNKVIALPFKGINKVLSAIKNVKIFKLHPFKNIVDTIDIPELPTLARGAVLDRGARAVVAGEDGAEAIVPLEKNTGWISKVVQGVLKELKTKLNPDDFKIDVVLGPGGGGTSGRGGMGGYEGSTTNLTFNQYNTSPKALDQLAIYKQTNNLLFAAKVRM